jgi:hypothetical protein
MNISEEAVSEAILDNIKACAMDARNALGPDFADADPPEVVNAIDDFAYHWQKGERPSTDLIAGGEDARLVMGSLWGEQLVKQFGWEWAKVTFHDHGDSVTFGVFSPDRSLAIYPLDFMLGCLNDPGVDVTVMLSYNMLEGGKIPKLESKSYSNVMEGVHRIVPRA